MAPLGQRLVRRHEDAAALVVLAFDRAAAIEVWAIVDSLADDPFVPGDVHARVITSTGSRAIKIVDDGITCSDVRAALRGLSLVDDGGHFWDADATVAGAGQRCGAERADRVLPTPIRVRLRPREKKHGPIRLLSSRARFVKC